MNSYHATDLHSCDQVCTNHVGSFDDPGCSTVLKAGRPTKFTGTIEEEGVVQRVSYTFITDDAHHFHGVGTDIDGSFRVQHGMYNSKNDRIAWYQCGSVHTVVTGEIMNDVFAGTTECKNNGVVGTLQLQVHSDAPATNSSDTSPDRSFHKTEVGKVVLLRSHRGLVDQALLLLFIPLHLAKIHYNRYLAESSSLMT